MLNGIVLKRAGLGVFLILLVTTTGLVAQSSRLTTRRPGHPPAIRSIQRPHTPNYQFGDPIPGLTDQQALDFSLGQAQFNGPEDVEDGLGPIFNAQSCNACHTQPLKTAGIPTSGGASAITETRFGTSEGAFDLLHQACITPEVQDIVPPTATIIAHRKTTPLFGLGLMEAIPDDTIKANVHTPPVDGVKGKAALVIDPITKAKPSRPVRLEVPTGNRRCIQRRRLCQRNGDCQPGVSFGFRAAHYQRSGRSHVRTFS